MEEKEIEVKVKVGSEKHIQNAEDVNAIIDYSRMVGTLCATFTEAVRLTTKEMTDSKRYLIAGRALQLLHQHHFGLGTMLAEKQLIEAEADAQQIPAKE